jgi:hypothetical protein
LATSKICSYCGVRVATDKEHVFPKNLYPDSKAQSRVQRMRIPSCNICNNGWSDDEAHFRNILGLLEKPNDSQRELWETTILRSFTKLDGARRIRDLVNNMRPVEVDGQPRHKIYPGEDARVVRVVKKVVRGLSHYHQVMTAVPDSRIWVDVMKYGIPDEFLSEMICEHREQDIVEYRYSVLEDYGIHSAWLITFFEKVTFIGLVLSSDNSLIENAG